MHNINNLYRYFTEKLLSIEQKAQSKSDFLSIAQFLVDIITESTICASTSLLMVKDDSYELITSAPEANHIVRILKKEFIEFLLIEDGLRLTNNPLSLYIPKDFQAIKVLKKAPDTEKRILTQRLNNSVIFPICIKDDCLGLLLLSSIADIDVIVEVLSLIHLLAIRLIPVFQKKMISNSTLLSTESTQENIERLQLFLNNPKIPMIFFNKQGRITYFNNGMEILTGFSRKDLYFDTNIQEFIEDLKLTKKSWLQNLDENNASSYNTKILTVSGKIIPVEMYIYPTDITGEGDKTFISLFTDRSHLVELERKTSFLSAAITSSLDGMAILNRMFCIQMTNNAFAASFKREPADLVGINFFDLHENSIGMEEEDKVLARIKNKGYWRGLLSVENDEKQPELYEKGIYSIKEESSGREIGFIVISRNVTDIEEQKNRIQSLRTRLKAFGEIAVPSRVLQAISSHFVNITKSIQAITDFQTAAIIIFDVYEPYYSIYKSDQDMELHIPFITVNPVKPEDVIKNLKNGMILSEKVFALDEACNKPEIWEKNSWVYVPLTDDKENTVGLLCCSQYDKPSLPDSISILSLEVFASQLSLILQIKKLRDAVNYHRKEMEDFVYSVSHDLKTPLMSVNGFADIIYQNYKDKLKDEELHYLQRLMANVRTINDMVKDLLTLARAGKVSQIMETIDINKESQQIIKDVLQTDKIPFEFEYEGDDPEIVADRSGVHTILTNLLTNTIKFKNPSRELKVILKLRTTPAEYIISIEDNGIGIAENQKSKIFEPFTRLTSGSIEGTGMGLTIVKKVVESRNGRIWFNTKENKGTTFYVSLPLKS